MLNFLILMAVPAIIAIAVLFVFNKKVTIGEFAIILVIPMVFILAGMGIAYHQRTSDTEIWNGMIATKRGKVPVPCEHSYSCHCHEVCSGSGKDRSCHTECDTCYEHHGMFETTQGNDYSWFLDATTGETTAIARIDRQGVNMPPRWGTAYVGEPYASQHSYTNYILANPESVLLGGKGDVERFKALIPAYPSVFDYYNVNHVINMGVPNLDVKTWEWLIRESNKTLGPMKQVNFVIIFAKTADPKYVLALKDSWIGGKKNDVVVVIGSEDGHKIEFADVVSWTPNSAFKIDLRDAIMEIGTLDNRDAIMKQITEMTATRFKRMHMKEYEYLMRSFQPSSEAMWWIFGLATLATIGAAVWSVLNSWDDEHDFEGNRKYGSILGTRINLPKMPWQKEELRKCDLPRSESPYSRKSFNEPTKPAKTWSRTRIRP